MSRPTLDDILASLLRAEDGMPARTLPERFCADCLTILDITGVALVLTGSDGHHLLVGASDPVAGRLGDREFSLGEGPGVQANQSGGPVLVTDLSSAHSSARWPAYAAVVSETPARSQFSYPLQIGVIRLGVLILYRDVATPLTADDAASALVLADAATVLLLHLQDVARRVDELHGEVASAFVATAELHQATGVVSVQAGVTMGEALLLLHARAFSDGRTSLEVARDVLRGKVNFHGDWGHDGHR